MAEAAVLGVAKSVLQQLAPPASTKFLLVWNFDKDLNRLAETVQTITDFLHDAEQRESKEVLVKRWLSRLRLTLYDADDLFDAVAARALRKKAMSGNTFMKEVRLFFSKSNQLDFVVRIAHDVKDIKERLDDIKEDMLPFNFQSLKVEENFSLVNLNRETHSFVDVKKVIGRDDDREKIISLLLSEKTGHRNLSVISIIGFGGLGKTTLAQLVYNDERVQASFDLCLWACINYFSDLKSVLVTILTSALKSKPQDLNLDQLQEKLREIIKEKKMLLVLDDVWEDDASNWAKLETLLNCGKGGSKVLATTRNTNVAQCLESMKPYCQLNVLSEDHAWSLFEKMTFGDDESSSDHSELVPLGREIVRRCGYVPLAIVTIGRMLRSRKKDEKLWSSFIENELPDVFRDDTHNTKLMEVLKLSYNYLPPAFKYCFAYCSLYPKDHDFDKDELVRMWVAQGFLEPSAKKSLEEVGDECFFYMVDRCFFQEVKEDRENGNIRYTCKMHDLLHDLAIQVAGMESRCFIGEDLEGMGGGSSLRHISVNCDPNFSFDPFVLSPHSKTLRTLLLGGAEDYKTSSWNSLLGSFKMLRALQLSSLDVDVLPDSFGGLIHLRYLDLSQNQRLKKVPNSICKLQHLQTLDLRRCKSLVELPSKLGKLVSLRHLFLKDCESLGSLPSGLAEITTLVSLDRLIVHPCNGGLRYLGCLDDLCGLVKIELPVKGWSDCVEDARKSSMSKKQKLNGMIIDWIVDGEIETTKEEETQVVLEALRPHENLQYLSIKGYAGDKLSSWVVSLSNLKELRLYGCTLEYLYPEDVKFESILPCLEILKMESLRNLKGWWREVAVLGDNSPISKSPSLSRVSEVSIIECPNLVEGMPLFRGIEELHLKKVNGKLVDKLLSTRTPNLKRIYLSYVKDLSCVPKDSIKCLTSLKSLQIEVCQELRWVSSCGLAYLTALKELKISDCGNVKFEDKDEEDEKEEINNNSGLGMPWKALQRLRILIVPWQRHLQGGLQYLTALESLHIEYYEKKQVEADNEMVEKGLHLPALQTLSIDFNEMPYSCFPKWIQRLRFLKVLYLNNCVELRMSWTMLANMNYLQQLFIWDVQKVVNVDETEAEQQIQFSSLIRLDIHFMEDGSCLNEVPWNLFPSLRFLNLAYIKNLESIPNGIQHLTSLKQLSIWRTTSELGKRCKPQVGEDWPLISHIPSIFINWRDEDGLKEIDVKP